MDKTELKKIVEAALLASDRPLSVPQLDDLFQGDDQASVSHEELATALESLREDCANRGIELLEVASGFRFQVRQEIHLWIRRLWAERPSRYSRALLETLALIAYRQPITRGEIEQVRGVSVSSNIIRTLEEREWIRVVGHRDTPGRPALFGTTRGFLDYFKLKSLDELPPLAEILNLEDPQLAFAPTDDIPAHLEAPETTVANSDAPADTEVDAVDEADEVETDSDLSMTEAESADTDLGHEDTTQAKGNDSDSTADASLPAQNNPEENRA